MPDNLYSLRLQFYRFYFYWKPILLHIHHLFIWLNRRYNIYSYFNSHFLINIITVTESRKCSIYLVFEDFWVSSKYIMTFYIHDLSAKNFDVQLKRNPRLFIHLKISVLNYAKITHASKIIVMCREFIKHPCSNIYSFLY